MHGWSGALFLATGLSALFAFGVIQSAFAPQAQALFFVFSVVFLLVAIGNWVGREHGHAAASAGKRIGLLLLIGGIAAVTYAWVSNGWTAECAGREIDRMVAGLSDQAVETLSDMRERASDDGQ